MGLSVCLMTSRPPGRASAAIEPLRGIAREIVIAVDSRVDPRLLGGYAALATRVLRFEYVLFEQQLAWLHAQCRGDWILRLDDDEVPSPALVARLPELLARRDVSQFCIRRRWVFPDPGAVLDEPPWSSDFCNRLVRSGPRLRFSGERHTGAVPAEDRAHVAEPILHLDLLLSAEADRRRKVVEYEATRPRMRAHGGGRMNEAFYLPEQRSELALSELGAEDRTAVERALAVGAADVTPIAPAPSLTIVPAAQSLRFWEGRAVPESGYRASVEPLERGTRMASGEERSVYVTVANLGSERWPDRLDARPAIRLAYRWFAAGAGVPLAEGERTPFPHEIAPGERALCPVTVRAPVRPGAYELEVDIVHELVRWFGCGCRLPVSVGDPPGLAAAGPRLATTRVPRMRRLRRVRIPQVIHRVWLGESQLPARDRAFGDSFARHHPGWRMRLWTDADLPALEIRDGERSRARSHAELSNLVRYEVLARFGGVYVDTDVECRRPLTPLLRGVGAFAGLEDEGRLGNAVLGAVAGHPVMARAAREARASLGLGPDSPTATGPYFLTLVTEQEGGVTVHPPSRFYPYRWDERPLPADAFPDAFTVHHWSMTWRQ